MVPNWDLVNRAARFPQDPSPRVFSSRPHALGGAFPVIPGLVLDGLGFGAGLGGPLGGADGAEVLVRHAGEEFQEELLLFVLGQLQVAELRQGGVGLGA